MPVLTRDDVVFALNTGDEPSQILDRLGPGVLPFLPTLIADVGNPGLAVRAAYLAGFIEVPAALQALAAASRSPLEVVRVAVASAFARLSVAGQRGLADALLRDESAHVRRVALDGLVAGSATARPVTSLLRRLAEKDPDVQVRESAAFQLARVHGSHR
jgi:HEAT repeat protein